MSDITTHFIQTTQNIQKFNEINGVATARGKSSANQRLLKNPSQTPPFVTACNNVVRIVHNLIEMAVKDNQDQL